MEVRTGRLVNEHPPGLFTEHTDKFIVDDDDMDSDTDAESDMSLQNQIILAQGEWSSAKDSRPILKRCNTRQQQTFLDMVNVYRVIGEIGPLGWGPNAQKDQIQRECWGLGSIPA